MTRGSGQSSYKLLSEIVAHELHRIKMSSGLFPFISGEKYSRADVFDILGLDPHPNGGNWYTGYNTYKGAHFIFSNVESSGRTGHNYDNHWIDDDRLIWEGKTSSHINQPQIKSMISGEEPVYLFYRSRDRNPFTFAGLANKLSVEDTRPVRITWAIQRITEYRISQDIELQEGLVQSELPKEGAAKVITTTVYERNPKARRECINANGTCCVVCDVDFGKRYGKRGEGFIHVHHLRPVSSMKGRPYDLDPINDLVPVCPNCHAMLHRGKELLTPEELREILLSKEDTLL